MIQLRKQHAASQTSHEKRRHDLDLQVLEIEDLRKALTKATSHTASLQQARDSLQQKLLSQTSKNSDVAKTIALLESDLRKVRRDAEDFGRDLKVLRGPKERVEEERKEEKERAVRRIKQRESDIRILREELNGQKERAKEGEVRLNGHVCAA